mmetsp:Transcript_28500/g.51892  ORF Transcript_28500/g.51892 Transcript_28500/m.51892 type:complete len:123 (-) Transcript_28500:1-369(-)
MDVSSDADSRMGPMSRKKRFDLEVEFIIVPSSLFALLNLPCFHSIVKWIVMAPTHIMKRRMPNRQQTGTMSSLGKSGRRPRVPVVPPSFLRMMVWLLLEGNGLNTSDVGAVPAQNRSWYRHA